jgi:AraC-like DNA-binding protein
MLATVPQEAFTPDKFPRAVSAIGMELAKDDYRQEPHAHRKSQLVVAIRGLVTCEVEKALWTVRPHCALWIPSWREHTVRCIGNVEFYVLFVDPDVLPGLPRNCCTICVSPLLRELVAEVSHLPSLYEQHGSNGRLINTMFDQLVAAPSEHLHLLMPSDRRLRRIADALLADPADDASVAEWARRFGLSERTLSRLMFRDTGMTFGRWRRQCHIMLAIERLSQGKAVQTVAFDLGYESAGAFSTMFRKTLGVSPAKYLTTRRGHGVPVSVGPGDL